MIKLISYGEATERKIRRPWFLDVIAFDSERVLGIWFAE